MLPVTLETRIEFSLTLTPNTSLLLYSFAFATCEFLHNFLKISGKKSSCFWRKAFSLLISVLLLCFVFVSAAVKWARHEGLQWSLVLCPSDCAQCRAQWCASSWSDSFVCVCVTFHKSVCPAQLRLANFQVFKLHWSLVNKTPATQPPSYIDLQRALQTILFVRSLSLWLCFQLRGFQLLAVPVTQGFLFTGQAPHAW